MALKVAMHNWMRPEPIETTISRLARAGYDGIEIAGEPAVYDAGQVRSLLEEHGLECWGSVTLMVGGRDLLHEDKYVRIGSIQYVKDTIDLIDALGGKILTVVPSTVGKIVPMASPEEEWGWAVESLKECQSYAEEKGVRIALEPLNRFETYFLNRHDQALALAERACNRRAGRPALEEGFGRLVGGDGVVDRVEHLEAQPVLAEAQMDDLRQVARVDVAPGIALARRRIG